MRLIHRMMRAWRLRARDEGAVTAEFAVALPAVIAVLALCLSAAAVGIAQSRLEESSRVAARAFARGDNLAAVQHEVSRIDPSINLQVQTVEETSGARHMWWSILLHCWNWPKKAWCVSYSLKIMAKSKSA